MTDLLEQTDTEIILDEELEEDPNAPDKERHAYSKEDLDANLFEGAVIQALCGHIKRGLAHPDSTLPACELCVALLETFRPE
jgi:hypothetical protein